MLQNNVLKRIFFKNYIRIMTVTLLIDRENERWLIAIISDGIRLCYEIFIFKNKKQKNRSCWGQNWSRKLIQNVLFDIHKESLSQQSLQSSVKNDQTSLVPSRTDWSDNWKKLRWFHDHARRGRPWPGLKYANLLMWPHMGQGSKNFKKNTNPVQLDSQSNANQIPL